MQWLNVFGSWYEEEHLASRVRFASSLATSALSGLLSLRLSEIVVVRAPSVSNDLKEPKQSCLPQPERRTLLLITRAMVIRTLASLPSTAGTNARNMYTQYACPRECVHQPWRRERRHEGESIVVAMFDACIGLPAKGARCAELIV